MIKIYRAIIVLLSVLFFGLGAGVINFILLPLGGLFVKNKKLYCSKILQDSWKFFIAMLEATGIIKLEISNYDALVATRGKIIVSTHPSLIDIVILTALIPKTLCIVKKQLTNNLLFGNILRENYIINDVDIEEFKKSAINALKEGYNIAIFPTGKRNKHNGEGLKIHKGAALLAIASGVPIVPVSMKTSYSFLGLGQPFWDAGDRTVTYTIKVGEEISAESLAKEAASEISLRNLITKKIKENIS